MSIRSERFPAGPGPIQLDLRCPSGSLDVEAVDGATEVVVSIEALDAAAEALLDRVDVDWSGSRLRVAVPERRLLRPPALAVRVQTPAGATVEAACASADARLRGRLGAVTIASASGDLSVEHCAAVHARSASGDARIGAVDGDATISTASGDIELGPVGGSVQVRTASGDVSVDDVGGDLAATTASGDITIGRASRGTVRLKTVSGDATVGVEPGLRLWLDLQSISGRLDSQLDEEPPEDNSGKHAQLAVLLQSVSGDLRIRRAVPRPPAPPTS